MAPLSLVASGAAAPLAGPMPAPVPAVDRPAEGLLTGRFQAADGLDAKALLAAAAAGDQSACRRIYRENVDRVYRTAARILGIHDGDVDDVVQQTFLAALEAGRREGGGGFDGRSKLSTFLIGIASRRALDAARERQRRSRWAKVPLLGALLPGALTPGRSAEPADIDDRSFATWALSHLSPEQRQVFVLHEVEGHTLQEISDMTGTGISTLHARLASARKKLDGLVSTSAAVAPMDRGGPPHGRPSKEQGR